MRTWECNDPDRYRPVAAPLDRCAELLGVDLAAVTSIDGYFAFLEQRYAGEIARRFGVAVASPIDPFNRPRHRGEFGLRVPPSQQALRESFASWPWRCRRLASPRSPAATT
jgi:hypothetical protein